MGVSVQSFSAACIAALRAALSASVSFGIANTALTALNASVSRSMISRYCPLRRCAVFSVAIASS